jgi:hypothetical protein
LRIFPIDQTEKSEILGYGVIFVDKIAKNLSKGGFAQSAV